MMDVTLYRLSIPFAIVTGCVAGLFAVQSWEILRESPFGLPLKILAVVMAITTVYHGGLLVFGPETLVLQVLLILGYILILIAFLDVVQELRDDVWDNGMFRHRNMFFATVIGLLLYAVVGPFSEIFFPQVLHWIHGFAALFAIMGLYNPVHDDFQMNPWNELLLHNAADGRQPHDWMMPIDDAILGLLYSSELILTPAVIAYNINYSRDEVNRRLTRLEKEGLVKRVERGKYTLSDRGESYIEA